MFLRLPTFLALFTLALSSCSTGGVKENIDTHSSNNQKNIINDSLLKVDQFIISQIFQETKCNTWMKNRSISTCLIKYPEFKAGKYFFYFQSGLSFQEKVKYQPFLQLSPEGKANYIKNNPDILPEKILYFFALKEEQRMLYVEAETEFLADKIIDLWHSLLMPISNNFSDEKQITELKNKLELEVNFYFGKDDNYHSKFSFIEGTSIEKKKQDITVL